DLLYALLLAADEVTYQFAVVRKPARFNLGGDPGVLLVCNGDGLANGCHGRFPTWMVMRGWYDIFILFARLGFHDHRVSGRARGKLARIGANRANRQSRETKRPE